jgi:hypothetical protein
MQPGGDMVAGRVDERPERELAGAAIVHRGPFEGSWASAHHRQHKQASSSFLKKRTKRLFPLEPRRSPAAHAKVGKVLLLFFKKEALPFPFLPL